MKIKVFVDEFFSNADWKDFILFKVCVAAVGFLLGLSVREEKKRPWLAVSFMIFLAAYIPLMMKFVPILLRPARECGMYAGAHEELDEE